MEASFNLLRYLSGQVNFSRKYAILRNYLELDGFEEIGLDEKGEIRIDFTDLNYSVPDHYRKEGFIPSTAPVHELVIVPTATQDQIFFYQRLLKRGELSIFKPNKRGELLNWQGRIDFNNIRLSPVEDMQSNVDLWNKGLVRIISTNQEPNDNAMGFGLVYPSRYVDIAVTDINKFFERKYN